MPRTAIDPWAAFDAAADPVRHALRLARLNETARSGRRVADSVRSVIDRSWQRSAAAGVDPSIDRAPVALDGDALEGRRSDHPLAPVRGILTQVLRQLAPTGPHVLALSDGSGLLLWVDGADEAIERASQEMAFAAGADWSERAAGTNAVGTALAEDHAVQIFSAEHFRPAVHGWTCSAAPIHDPETGEVLGVLDATADLRTVDPRTLPFLAGAARAAEEILRAHARRRDARLLEQIRQRPSGAPRPVLAVSPRGRVIDLGGQDRWPADGAAADSRWRLPVPGPEGGELLLPDGRTGHAVAVGTDGFLVYPVDAPRRSRPRIDLRLLGTASPLAGIGSPSPVHGAPPSHVPLSRSHAEVLALLVAHPDGLSAERLAVLLHGDRANDSTARAACSRLRSRLPGAVLTRPYRLAPGVASDLDDVRQRLSAGDLAGAVGAYRGPLLPDSDAPGVRDIADALHAELRGALLEAGDAEALAAWCARPHGSEDLLAAEALVRSLPHGDPRRGAAAGRIAALRRRLGLRSAPGAVPANA